MSEKKGKEKKFDSDRESEGGKVSVDEADITINGVHLSRAQSMSVRVAIGQMLLSVREPEFAADLGPVAALYEERLAEVERIIIR